MKSNLFRPSTLVPLLVLAALAALPFIASATGQTYWTAMFARILIYAIAASALNLALGYGGLVSLGHALFIGLGSYAVALPSHLGVGNGFAHLFLCLVVCGGVALVTGAISLRTSGAAFIMITLAFAQMGYYLFISLKQFGGDDGLPITLTSSFGSLALGSPTAVYCVSYGLLLLTLWMLARLRVAPFGMVLRGARENPRRVNAMGLRVFRFQLAAYVISGMLCGLAGMLLANLTAFASPSSLGWTVSGDLIVIVIVGGIGTVFGPLIGAVVFLGLEDIIKAYTQHWAVIFGPLILLLALTGKLGVMGLLQRLDSSSPPPGAKVAPQSEAAQ